MFSHIEKSAEAGVLRGLLEDTAAIAFHADADGFCAGFMATRLTPGVTPLMFQVFTEDLDLAPLSDWVRRESVGNLITFDVNMLSAAGALSRLAENVPGRLRIYDDHVGAPASIPDNVDIVNLLPPVADKLPKISPRVAVLLRTGARC